MCEKEKIAQIKTIINEWRNSETASSSTLALDYYLRRIKKCYSEI